MRIGLALGSGGARGWCHIGVLQRLSERGIEPDVVAGCSMGAVVGAAWSAGCLDELEDWARGLNLQTFIRYVDIRMSGGGLLHGAAIGNVLESLGVSRNFADLAHPFLAVATDMATGREIWLQEGNVIDAVRGSASIPGVFSPHKVRGKWLLDGGLTNPVPVSACRALGADVTISVNPNSRQGHFIWEAQPRKKGIWDMLGQPAIYDNLPESWRLPVEEKRIYEAPPGYMDVIATSIDVMTEFVRHARAAIDPPDLALEAELRDITVLELYRANEAIEEGRRLVDENFERIEKLLDRA